MFTVKAYRSLSGNFNFTSPWNLKAIHYKIILGYRISSSDFNYLFKSVSSCLILHFAINLILSGDIELNPGPLIPNKCIQGSFHQGDPCFGNTAGSQCMCNAFWAVCYSKIKCVQFWAQWDLDTILDHGDKLYKENGCTQEHLSFTDLPNRINVNRRNIDVEKSELVTAQLLPNTASFLILPQGFNCGIFLACG